MLQMFLTFIYANKIKIELGYSPKKEDNLHFR